MIDLYLLRTSTLNSSVGLKVPGRDLYLLVYFSSCEGHVGGYMFIFKSCLLVDNVYHI